MTQLIFRTVILGISPGSPLRDHAVVGCVDLLDVKYRVPFLHSYCLTILAMTISYRLGKVHLVFGFRWRTSEELSQRSESRQNQGNRNGMNP